MSPTDDHHGPAQECDVIMKGGITSGVIYPRALTALSRTYRFRGIGGTSAGAIGAACAAAAELGRERGGFDRLETLPDALGGGRLAALFQPQPATKQLLPLLMAATGNVAPGRVTRRFVTVPLALVRAFPVTSAATALVAAAVIIAGVAIGGGAGAFLAIPGVVLVVLVGAGALALRTYWKIAHDVPANLLGICRGLSEGGNGPGFTDWLSDTIDDLAGLEDGAGPLTFGDLWGSDTPDAEDDPTTRRIDLRMITTCISRSRPYEMPWASRNFFYDPAVWSTLFPAEVMQALAAHPAAGPDKAADVEDGAPGRAWEWEEQMAARHDPPLRRLPGPRDLPVIVATRLSLSFPLLISAVPLWSIDHRSSSPGDDTAAFEALWFTDGGLCSNFPVHLFDAPLPSRPTFAINLGRFSEGQEPSPDQSRNVEIARTNRDGLLPPYRVIPSEGIGAVTGFLGSAFDTIRNWQDNSYLDAPGHRDRIVRILQTPHEGGLNLYMESDTITELAQRGAAGADALVDQFNRPHYKTEASPTRTGWENHRWIRFRALTATLPEFLAGYARGRAALDTDPNDPPSYDTWLRAERDLSLALADSLDGTARVAADADATTVAGVAAVPARAGSLRRTPRM